MVPVEMNEHDEELIVDESFINDIVTNAQKLLSQRFGGSQKLTDIQLLSGSGIAVVIRARLVASPFIQQRSVILKHMPLTGLLFDHSAFLREIVAYQFTTSLPEEARPGPVLLAHDVEKRLIVISDSGDGDTFAQLLDTKDDRVRLSILRDLGEAIGKMHAGTAGKEQDFAILLNRMLLKHKNVQEIYKYRERVILSSIPVGKSLLQRVGIQIPEVVEEYARSAQHRLTAGHHRGFTPFDLSPDNIIVANKTHFLDYESAGFRDCTFDIACVIAGFPQYLSSRSISDEEADVFIQAWLNEISDTWPHTRDPQWLSNRIMSSLLGWALSSLTMMLFQVDPEWYIDDLDSVLAQEKKECDNEHDSETLCEFFSPITELIFGDPHDVPHDFLMIRQDIRETFEAIYRYAVRGRDLQFASVAQFSAEVIKFLDVKQT
ncbi:phosphotransferase [Corynebacterium sp. sy039]|nr:phosphotransferase [Corynebacterium sp. sy039]